jgi:peptidoglycan/LPS O-acetylase OafA/YrhL
MSKPLFGLVLGAILGIFDGLSALVSSPEVSSQITGIVIGSTVKGLIAGVLIGWFARRVNSLPLGIVFGLVVGALLALPIAIMNSNALHHNYYWQIMLPGSAVGLIVGYATQRHEPSRGSTVNA